MVLKREGVMRFMLGDYGTSSKVKDLVMDEKEKVENEKERKERKGTIQYYTRKIRKWFFHALFKDNFGILNKKFYRQKELDGICKMLLNEVIFMREEMRLLKVGYEIPVKKLLDKQKKLFEAEIHEVKEKVKLLEELKKREAATSKLEHNTTVRKLMEEQKKLMEEQKKSMTEEFIEN